MFGFIKKFDDSFTDKRKGFFALGALAFAVLWLILWYVFPMEWYALFYATTVGSYVNLVLLAAVLILPMCWAATKAMSCNVSVTKNFVVNIIFMVGILFLFSAFRYSAVYVVIIAAVLHIAAMVWVLGTAEPHDKKHTKRVKDNEKSLFGIFRSDGDEKVLPIKKQPLIVIMWAVIYTLIIDGANIFLFWEVAHIFNS